MNDTLVSVIMPVYNRAAFVARAIDSVLAQTYPHWELLVVDDGSTDGTRRVLEGYGERLTVLAQANAGPYPARNVALRHARGDLVAFIDSDDVWYPHRLECQLPLLQRPEVALVFGDGALVDYGAATPRRLTRTYFTDLPPSRGRAFAQLTRRNFIPQSSVLVRRVCFEELGGFSLACRTGADYAKWLQIAMRYEIDYVPTCVFEYGIHAENFSEEPLRAVFAPVRLFDELIDCASDASMRRELRHLILDFQVRVAVAMVKTGLKRIFQTLFRPSGAVALAGVWRRLAWVAGSLWRSLLESVHGLSR